LTYLQATEFRLSLRGATRRSNLNRAERNEHDIASLHSQWQICHYYIIMNLSMRTWAGQSRQLRRTIPDKPPRQATAGTREAAVRPQPHSLEDQFDGTRDVVLAIEG
jgi:hypothetical protein